MKLILTSAICLLTFYMAFGQDIHLSQFYMSPLTMNAAKAGAEYDLEAIINYKNQWQAIGSPYKTLAASVDGRYKTKKKSSHNRYSAGKKSFWGGGINLISDKAGDIKMGLTEISFSAARHVYLSQYSTLGAGLQGGLSQRSISYEGVTWGNQYDGNSYNPALPSLEPTGTTSFSYADLGAGIFWNYNNTSGLIKVTDNHDLKASFGFSAFHLARPMYSYYSSQEKLYIKYVLHGNALISVPNSNIAFAPGFMFFRQGPTQEIYPGTMIRYKLRQASKYTGYYQDASISLGGFLRVKDAVAITLLLEQSNYAVGISYDVNTSSLKKATTGKGGFEISLKYSNLKRRKMSRSKF